MRRGCGVVIRACTANTASKTAVVAVSTESSAERRAVREEGGGGGETERQREQQRERERERERDRQRERERERELVE